MTRNKWNGTHQKWTNKKADNNNNNNNGGNQMSDYFAASQQHCKPTKWYKSGRWQTRLLGSSWIAFEFECFSHHVISFDRLLTLFVVVVSLMLCRVHIRSDAEEANQLYLVNDDVIKRNRVALSMRCERRKIMI